MQSQSQGGRAAREFLGAKFQGPDVNAVGGCSLPVRVTRNGIELLYG